MLAHAKSGPSEPKSVMLASAAATANPRTTVIAAGNGARPDAVKPKPAVALAAQAATTPRPIILAMLPPGHPVQAPQSIADLIRMDSKRP
jgi:hypothetical protein